MNYVDPTGHVSVGSLLTGGIVGTITTAIANIKVTILEVIRPHADKIFGKGSRAKIDRDIALAKAARDRVIKFYCGQAERIAASKKSQAGFYANLERFANDYWYVPIASDIAEVGVSSNNGDIPKTIFNLGMLVAGVTPAKAIHGTSKLSPIIAKLFKGTDKAEDAVKITDKVAEASDAVVLSTKASSEGGVVTRVIGVGERTFEFKHGFRHVDFDEEGLEKAIAVDASKRDIPKNGVSNKYSLVYEGAEYQYRIYNRGGNLYSVGTYFEPEH